MAASASPGDFARDVGGAQGGAMGLSRSVSLESVLPTDEQGMQELAESITARLEYIQDGQGRSLMRPDANQEAQVPDLNEDTPLTLEWVTRMMDQFVLGAVLGRDNVLEILRRSALILGRRPNVCKVTLFENCRVNVVGDLHGQLADLVTIFRLSGLPNERNAYVFNGDVVDRGAQSVECLLTVLALLCVYPNAVFLNRGNHESRLMNKKDGFQNEVAVVKYDLAVFECFTELFCLLPFATVIQDKVFVVHGGLCWSTPHLLQLQAEDRLFEDPPDDSLMKDLLWSDPCDGMGVHENSDRGAGVLFGPDMSEMFLDRNDLDLIVRSHECVDDGYLMSHGGLCLTLFSASNFAMVCDNLGAFAIFTPDLVPRFVQFRAEPLHHTAACFSYRQTLLEDEVAWKLPHLIHRHYLALIDYWSKGPGAPAGAAASMMSSSSGADESGSDSEGEQSQSNSSTTAANTAAGAGADAGASQGTAPRRRLRRPRIARRSVISRRGWAQGLRRVLGLKIDFIRFQRLLGLPELGVTGNVDGPINFLAWLSQFRHLPSRRSGANEPVASRPDQHSGNGVLGAAGASTPVEAADQPMEFDFETSDSDSDPEDDDEAMEDLPRASASMETPRLTVGLPPSPQPQQQQEVFGGRPLRPQQLQRATQSAGASQGIRMALQAASINDPTPGVFSDPGMEGMRRDIVQDPDADGMGDDDGFQQVSGHHGDAGHRMMDEHGEADDEEEDDDPEEEMFERAEASSGRQSAADYDDDLTVWEWDVDEDLPPPPPPFDAVVEERVLPAIEEARRGIEELRLRAQQQWLEHLERETAKPRSTHLDQQAQELGLSQETSAGDQQNVAGSETPDAAPSPKPRRRRPLDPEVYRAGRRLLKQISAVLFVNRFEVETLWRFFDRSGCGSLSRRELQDGIRSLMGQKSLPPRITESEIYSAFAVLLHDASADASASGSGSAGPDTTDDLDRRSISYETFCRVFSKTDPWFGVSGIGGSASLDSSAGATSASFSAASAANANDPAHPSPAGLSWASGVGGSGGGLEPGLLPPADPAGGMPLRRVTPTPSGSPSLGPVIAGPTPPGSPKHSQVRSTMRGLPRLPTTEESRQRRRASLPPVLSLFGNGGTGTGGTSAGGTNGAGSGAGYGSGNDAGNIAGGAGSGGGGDSSSGSDSEASEPYAGSRRRRTPDFSSSDAPAAPPQANSLAQPLPLPVPAESGPPVASAAASADTAARAANSANSASAAEGDAELSWEWLQRHLAWQKAADLRSEGRPAKRRRHSMQPSSAAGEYVLPPAAPHDAASANPPNQ